MPEYQSLIGFVPWDSVFTLCNLGILIWGIKKFLFRPVLAVLAKRQAELDTRYSEAQTAETQAKAMRDEYEMHLANAKEEATELVKSAAARAQQRSDDMLQQTQSEVSAMKQKAEQDIESARKKAAAELKNDISGIALSLAGKVVAQEIDETKHKELIDAFISNVGDAS